ncbi:MAG: 50S ribosomal protein L7ae [DPANN group archaeon]|nr:50S ribosomal protein L7ae [DPANN group archaeon]
MADEEKKEEAPEASVGAKEDTPKEVSPEEKGEDKSKEEPKKEAQPEENPEKAPKAPEEEPKEPKEKPKEESSAEEESKGGKVEVSSDKIFDIVEAVKASGKIRKGINEVTKTMERGDAKLVVVAKDISPPEVVMHLPLLAKEKGIPFAEVDTKEELGAAAGLEVPTSCIAVVVEGEAKESIKELRGE